MNIYTNKFSYFDNEFIKIYLTNTRSLNKIEYITISNFNDEIILKYKINDLNINTIDTNYTIKRLKDHINYKLSGFYFEIKPTFKKSSVYIIGYKLYLENTIYNQYPIVIKSSKYAKNIIVYPTNTITAYNRFHNYNFYYSFEHKEDKHENRAIQLPFQRPLKPVNLIYHYLDGFMKYIEKSNKDYNFICDLDLDDDINLKKCKNIVIIGHSEYWSQKAVINCNIFNKNGGNLIILSGNTMWWNIKYVNNNNDIVCYKLNAKEYENDNYTYKLVNSVDILNIIGLNFSYGGYGIKKFYNKNKYKSFSFSNSDHDKNENNHFKKYNINYNELIKKSRVAHELTDNSNKHIPGFYGYKILKNNMFNITSEYIDIETGEGDGLPVSNIDNDTILIDKDILHFKYYDVIGYDIGFRAGSLKIIGMIYCKKDDNYGFIFNAGTTNFCSSKTFLNKDIINIVNYLL